MQALTFNKKTFSRIAFTALVWNISWTLISPLLEELRDSDHGFITGLGFLLIYGIPFYVVIPKEKRSALPYLGLTLSTILVFLISSFVIVPLFIQHTTTLNDALAVICSSLFSAICLVLIVHQLHRIQFLILTMSATFICAVVVTAFMAFSIIDKFVNTGFEIFTMATFYATWQILTTIMIALGVSITKSNSETLRRQ